MARRTREEAEQTRQALLSTALKLFSQQGIAATTLKQVAQEAGVTHGAVYWHFRNRADLLQQIHHEFMLPFESQFLEQRQAVQQDALAALELYFLGVLGEFRRNAQAQQLYRVFYLQPTPVPDLASVQADIDGNRQLWLEQLKFFLKQARKQKQIRKKTVPVELADAIQRVLDGLLAHWLCQASDVDLRAQGKTLFGLIRDGLPQK